MCHVLTSAIRIVVDRELMKRLDDGWSIASRIVTIFLMVIVRRFQVVSPLDYQ